MLLLNSIILAIIQGLTEFLPISSSGHLLILHELLTYYKVNNLSLSSAIDSLTFDAALHLGTAAAIIFYFWPELKRFFIAFLNLFRSFNIADEKQKTVINLIIATIPAVIAGILIEPYLEKYIRNLTVVAIALIVGGVLFFIVERKSKQKLIYQGLSMPESFLIGLAQALALIPGVSRSGITIIAGMTLNLKRAEAAGFSFLLSLPIVLGAGLKKLFDLQFSAMDAQTILSFVLGIAVSALVGFCVIKYFMRFVEKRSLHIFGWYRIIVGAALLIWLYR
jgi:undecaprenyl-diphosphatase